MIRLLSVCVVVFALGCSRQAEPKPTEAKAVAVRDFTKWTSGGANVGKLTIAANKITATSVANADEFWVYKDYGAGAIGDFIHKFEATKSVDASTVMIWGMGNTVGTYQDRATASDGVSLLIADGTMRFFLFDHTDATNDGPYSGTVGTKYFVTVARSGTTLTATIRTGSHAGTVVDTLTLTVPETSYRYVYSIASRDSTGATTSTLVIDNFDDGISTTANLTYPSTIDASLTGLKAILHYPTYRSGTVPLVVVMHGWTQDSTDFDSEVGPRYAENGLACLLVDMRGRNSSSGTQDGSGREIADILDAVDYVIENYPTVAAADDVHAIGYSGGGGNVCLAGIRYPDRFGLIANFFGTTDYGFDQTDGWYFNTANPSHLDNMDAWIGDPATEPEKYKCRSSVVGITNFPGRLRIYHDEDDASVNVEQSDNLAAAFTGEVYSRSTSADGTRWTHALPNGTASVITAEPTIFGEITGGSYPPQDLSGNQTLLVLGWVACDDWEVWLGDGTADTGSVTFVDGSTPQFTITSDEGEAWTVKTKGHSASQTVRARVNGTTYEETADSDGVAAFTISSTEVTQSAATGGAIARPIARTIARTISRSICG